MAQPTKPAICGALLLAFAAHPAQAQTAVFQCNFGSFEFFITVYDGGATARIGERPGVGDRAWATRDPRNGAWSFIEVNGDDFPISMTTIQPDFLAVHSRHVLEFDGKILSPSQAQGRCTPK